MLGKAKAPIVLVVVAALLAVVASGATAATKTRIVKPTVTSSLNLRGTNRFWVEMSAERTGKRSALVTVSAEEERYKVESQSVAYSTHGRWSKDGGFEAKLPGLGAVDVTFNETKARRVRFEGGPNCSDQIVTLRKGTFNGTISYRGKGGFTVVHGKSAPGQIRETSRQVCHETVEEGETGGTELGSQPTPEEQTGIRNASVYASGRRAGAVITFSAAGPLAEGGILPPIAFGATYAGRWHGMQVLGQTYVDGPSKDFLVPAPAGALTDATVEPPSPPFAGTGVYHLESPTVASWTGDLRIAFPGIGTVPLAFPGMSARLCEGVGGTCSGSPVPPA